jgi:hypothetical protein
VAAVSARFAAKAAGESKGVSGAAMVARRVQSAPLDRVRRVPLAAVSVPLVLRRVTGGYSGNAHDRRKARRSGRAFAWYLAHLKARAAAL